MFSTDVVVEYLPTRLVVDWFPQASSDKPTIVNLAVGGGSIGQDRANYSHVMPPGSARVREGCDLQTGKVETGWSKGCYLDIIPIIPG